MTQEMQFATNSARRRHANTIERPMTYEPTSTSFFKPSVDPVRITRASATEKTISRWVFIVIGAVLGLLSGLILTSVVDGRGGHEAFHQSELIISGAGIPVFYIIWGLLVGAVFGLIMSLLYSAVKKGMPLFAAMLFIPTVLFLLTSPLAVLTNLLWQLLKIVLAIVVVIIVIAIAWAWLAG